MHDLTKWIVMARSRSQWRHEASTTIDRLQSRFTSNGNSALVPNRTEMQCRDRWIYTLDPSVDMTVARTGCWTTDEDIKLKAAVEKDGGKNWVAIYRATSWSNEKDVQG
jgi:hypothetical protein